MKKIYDHINIEKKWQTYWEETKMFKTYLDDKTKEKYYVLDMFPYPSGEGLHVGHPEGYTATDIIARYKRMCGYNVLHPIGFDAFGLPAEQYALKTGNNPSDFTLKNIYNFRKQIKSLGFSYDWNLEINTSDPKFYKWTQWIFIKLYENNLAELKEIPVNWCPELNSVLSNEEVVNGKSERGNYPVYQVPMKQWVLNITKYADRLLEDLDELDWPSNIKELQKKWIGRQSGYELAVNTTIPNIKEINIFIQNVSLLYASEFIIIAPEHSVSKILAKKNSSIAKYLKQTMRKSIFERLHNNKDLSGIFTGYYCYIPLTNIKIPIYLADYITGDKYAYVGNSLLSSLDKTFLEKNNIASEDTLIKKCNTDNYIKDFIFNSKIKMLEGKTILQADQKIINFLQTNNYFLNSTTTYKLRDWIFSRQRYWGEPFPIIYFEDGTVVVDKNLPLVLPKTDKITTSKDMQSPLANFKDWVEVDGKYYNKPGLKGFRDTNTMPQWAASSWYYLRYIDATNDKSLADFDKLKFWLPVDLYIGGKEHAVLHLLYVRFWHKVLYDLNLVPYKEPIKKLINQGMILGNDNNKMSKSKGNVVNPDTIVKQYGADSLRLYEMFMGPITSDKPWNMDGIKGARRFIERFYNYYVNFVNIVKEETPKLTYIYNFTIRKVTEDIEKLKFNTIISQSMIFLSELYKYDTINYIYAKNFIKLLSPIIPHVCEELWEFIGEKEKLAYSLWPKYDNTQLEKKTIKYIIQINGKFKLCIDCDLEKSESEIKKLALERAKRYLSEKEIKKIIFINNKVVNILI